MKSSRWALRSAVITAVGLTAATGLPAGLASAQPSASGPMVKLIVAQKSIKVPRYGKRVYIDPGVYVTAVGTPLRFNVQRASYAKPITNTQIIRVPGGPTITRHLPDWTVAKNWQGLHRFLRVTVRNSAGKIVASHVGPFCPDDFSAQRSNPNAPAKSRFPQQCQSDPFQLANVWGIQRGWGVDTGFLAPKLQLGTYKFTVNIVRLWQRFLHLTPRASTATVTVKVVKPSQCGTCARPVSRHHRNPSGTLPRLPANVPTLANPPASSLPDLSPLPSWGIGVQHFRGKNPTDQVVFGATVWSGGHARLDVEGFRSHGHPVMKAYQYFWKNGRIIGRARAGTMGFDDKPGHTHWHFEQFAQYKLLTKNKAVAVRSKKVGFCIAPTDPVNLLLPHASWQPVFLGFGGACGSQSALWVQEMMPIGWGDTYEQFLPGQAFNITNLPDGTYYIKIIANPQKVLHETNYRNDVSLRKIILGGTPGHRTVKVPAVHGIDPEHMG